MTAIHRIMTFNINSTFGDDDNTWQRRGPLATALINRYQPDIIGLQEAASENLATFQEQLAEYTIVQGNCYGDTPPQEYSSILYKSSRYTLLDSGEFWLSKTPEQESVDWGVEYPLGATWVKLLCLQTNWPLFCLNTHFEDGPWGEQHRIASSKLIIDKLAQLAPGLPIVLTGDYNCNPWSATYRLFMQDGFCDTFRAAGWGDSAETSTMHLYKGSDYFSLDYGIEQFWRVDWILAKGGAQPLQTTSSTIVRDATPPTYPSDHYPVVSEILL